MTSTPSPNPRPARFVLPHFEYVVPLLIGPHGYHYVPVFALCRMLGLDATYEIQRARHVLLWDMAALLPMSIAHRRRACVAWSLPYPLGVGSWFSQVYPRVHNVQLRAKLLRAIDDSMELSAVAHQLLQVNFEDGRRRMYQLSFQAARLRALAESLARRTGPDQHDDQQVLLGTLAARASALADQVETFIREWFAALGTLPVVDGVRADAEGRVLEQDVPLTLFAVMTHDDRARLEEFEQLVAKMISAAEAVDESTGEDDPSA